jgi:sporadic carbohydrate cluster 2OG-Fe(II) oxygenase
MFLTETERQLSNEYFKEGYVIRPVADDEALNRIRDHFAHVIGDALGKQDVADIDQLLNSIHNYVPVEKLNDFRLKIIRGINSIGEFRELYFRVARIYLETLVGNELAMQLRVNLSIQFPGDDSSLLPVHADTWSGDSPYEIVVWLPLVDCYDTKAMYLLSPQKTDELKSRFREAAGDSSEALYQAIKNDVKWLPVSYGEVMLFDQSLPHGNIVNKEPQTRWSMNCRFKGVFTPYGDKKIGEFFEPITLRPASRLGMKYRLPKI